MERTAESQATLVALRGQVAESLISLELAAAGAESLANAMSAVSALADAIDTAARLIGLERDVAWRVLAWRDEIASRLVLADCLVEGAESLGRTLAVMIDGVHAVDRNLWRLVTSPRTTV